MRKKKNKGEKNKGNEEDEDEREKKTVANIDDPDIDVELNEDFGISEYDDNSNNDKEEHITRTKVRPIKQTKKKKYPP